MIRLTTAICAAALLAGCAKANTEQAAQQPPVTTAPRRPPTNPLKNAYFGYLHLHTRNSFDAYIFNVRASYADEANATLQHFLSPGIGVTDYEHLISFDQHDTFGNAGYNGLVAAWMALKGSFTPAPADPTYTGLDVCTPATADTCVGGGK